MRGRRSLEEQEQEQDGLELAGVVRRRVKRGLLGRIVVGFRGFWLCAWVFSAIVFAVLIFSCHYYFGLGCVSLFFGAAVRCSDVNGLD